MTMQRLDLDHKPLQPADAALSSWKSRREISARLEIEMQKYLNGGGVIEEIPYGVQQEFDVSMQHQQKQSWAIANPGIEIVDTKNPTMPKALVPIDKMEPYFERALKGEAISAIFRETPYSESRFRYLFARWRDKVSARRGTIKSAGARRHAR